MKGLLYNIYIVLLSINLFFACQSTTDNTNNQEVLVAVNNDITVSKKQFETGEMKLGKLMTRQLPTTVSTRGYIDVPPGNRAAVSPFYGGYVKQIEVLPGQKIKKGQLLFTLQNPDYLKIQQAYLEAKEQLVYLETDYKRQQTLAEEKIASQKDYKKAEAEYRVMQVKYQGLKEQLALMNIAIAPLNQRKLTSTMAIYAPITGFITKVNTMKSAFINASEVALEIVNTDHIHLELQVFEKDAMHIKKHQKISFSVPESGSLTFTGEVYLVGKSVDTQQRTVDIHGHIADSETKNFIPGMYVDAAIEVNSEAAMCLPESAIVEIDGLNYILVQIKSASESLQFMKQQITIGKKSEGWVEIKNAKDIKDKTILLVGTFVLIGG
ncbi:MAG: cobalt-zinc-cadmium efflux system membrane fusion protein [Cyclobacteriaceae bacterium]|jgi:cobalt-zinc-cadmium efflux system membrane fusion protein